MNVTPVELDIDRFWFDEASTLVCPSVNLSTHDHSARIGVLNADGTVTSIRASQHGNLKYTGAILRKTYNEDHLIRRLLRKGDINVLKDSLDSVESFGTSMKRSLIELYCDPSNLLPGEIHSWYLFKNDAWYFKSSVDRKPLEDQLWKLVERSLNRRGKFK